MKKRLIRKVVGGAAMLAMLFSMGGVFPAEDRSESYARLILSEKGLAAYYRMEGDLADAKSDHAGMPRGGSVSFAAGPHGGKALKLEEGSFVMTEKPPQIDFAETTIELLFKMTEPPRHNSCLVAKRSEKETRFSIHVARDLTQIHVWNGRNVISANVPVAPLQVGRWYYLVVTATSEGLGVYLDGVLCARITGPSFNFSAKDLPFLIGAATPGGYEQFIGGIDEVAIYSRVLVEGDLDRHLDALGWAERKKLLLARKEEMLRQERAREEERRSRKMEEVAKRMEDPQLLARGETRVYRGDYLTAISFPLGGIGAGCIQINGKAERAIWQIFNNFIGASVPHSFFAVRAKSPDGQPIVRALQTTPVGPFEPMKSLTFRGEYPFAWYDFEDADLPVAVSLETFTPLIPLNARDSAMPCAVFTFTARNTSDSNLEASFMATQQNAVGFTGEGEIEGRRFPGYGGNVNAVLKRKGAAILHLMNDSKEETPFAGDMALAAFEENVSAAASWDTLESLLKDVSEDGILDDPDIAGPSPTGGTLDGALAVPFSLEPGRSRKVTFVLAWHFPNGRNGSGGWGGEGNMYANWWDGSVSVVDEVHKRFDELSQRTRLYHGTFYTSNLPQWLLDRISSQVAVLRSKTCFWTREGYFGGWEGCSPDSGCCHGNCAHVWHYAQAHARLFPSIARTMREESLAHQTADGKIPFRQPEGGVAIDGQCGEILEAYREHLCSADARWLHRHWPRVKKAMEYVIATWDKDEDGVLAGAQHNTLDVEAGGSTSWLGSLYLSSLAASERMAELRGEDDTAERFRRIRGLGCATQNETLWNGEYYIQIPDPRPYRDYNTGCHIDQVLGEWWANQVGLETHFPADRVRSAMRSLVKYNLRADFRGIPQTPRKFVSDEDAGMQMITWPREPRPDNHMLYADEAMTGFEYAAAATMIQYGMLKEGFLVTKAISDRYDGRLRSGLTATRYSSWGYSGNPFGDDECGKFYARAMSVWSMLLACQGYIYDGPRATIGFKPVWRPEDHATFFTAAEGWGRFVQRRDADRQMELIEVACGKLRCSTLVFELPDAAKLAAVRVEVAGEHVGAVVVQKDRQVTVSLDRERVVNAGEALRVLMAY